MILKEGSNFCSYKIKTIIMKNTREKLKNRNKKIKSKIINGFLVCKFLISCLYKPRKLINYYQNSTPANYFVKKQNKSNLIYPNYSLRYKIKYGLQIGSNLSWFIKLISLTVPTILLYIINLSRPILVAP